MKDERSMSKHYIEDLSAWVSKRKAARSRQDKNLVAFLAVKNDVADALTAGYSMKTIWEHLHELGRIDVRYETFTQYVKRHIKSKSPPQTQSPAGADQSQKKPRESPSDVGGFTFNSIPNKEDLI
jgi:hypothetical protein